MMLRMDWLSRIWGRKRHSERPRLAQVFLSNTLSGERELFVSQKPGVVLFYSCGPTVYGPAHIGNLRAYVCSDTIARVLHAAGYHVHRVINITDVGHLVGDGDQGEDKMTVAAKREKASPEEIAERYTKAFIEDIAALNIDTSDIQFPKATDYIKEQIALAKTLEEKGFAYHIEHGLAFDVSRFPGYGKLGHIDISAQRAGARIEEDPEKRHPADFWLWRKAKPGDLQQWDSPWGRGNPGWHIECSAMIRSLLGQEIDIHSGGEDHISVHHNNEIAQSEAANGRTLAHYWMHSAFLTMNGEKASKSLGNVVYLSDVIEKGFHPLSLRYFFLQAHYRTPLSFSWDALAGASGALERLWRLTQEIAQESKRVSAASEIRDRFLATVRDDLATPQALGILWDVLKSEEYAPEEKWGLIEDADAHFGLSLLAPPVVSVRKKLKDLSHDVQTMLRLREEARARKDFEEADRIRAEIKMRGYLVEDSPHGPIVQELP